MFFRPDVVQGDRPYFTCFLMFILYYGVFWFIDAYLLLHVFG